MCYKKQKETGTCHRILDKVLLLLVAYPFMVLYWNGAWGLWDFNTNSVYPSPRWFTILISSSRLVLLLSAPKLRQFLVHRSTNIQRLCSEAFTFISAFLLMGFWRGVWETCLYYTEEQRHLSLVAGSLSYALLIALRCSRNVLLQPLQQIPARNPETLLRLQLRFKSEV